ncbi:hypothetical protein HO173_003511 [Letharia columbiana]|uniref:Uncharacterized protein n=1 Tax=Letharia columbiana TaxID=112416 RepID=A0A8H6G0E7_9LECA|nr:uncharacterized protein HO173_003511 [Letharia columbiana]KAF6238231.1 hypothetical protein HO173_003511 [Letharia columbiana]
MRSFGSATTAFVIIGFFALTTFSAPSPWNPNNWSPKPKPAPSPSPVAPATPATTTTTSSSGGTGGTSGSSGSGSGSSGAGSGTPGYATIVNKCNFATYVYVCKQHPATCGSTVPIKANTGTYSEAYAASSDGGHSLKISVTSGSGNILQFEYTNGGNGDISYDLSEVNGNPFGTWGFSLTNTTTDSFCGPPATDCPAIFTDPTNGIPYTATTSDGVGAILCG